jgi:hypothetical protein
MSKWLHPRVPRMLSTMLAAGFAVVTAGALSSVVWAAILSTTGQMTKIAPPPSVEFHQLESNTTQFAFDERQCVTLARNLKVNITTPGTYDDFSDLTPGIIPAGTKVSSHFVHADKVGTGPPRIELEGTLTTDAPVLGIIIKQGQLNKSDFLGATGTVYPTGDFGRALQLDGQNEFVILDPNLQSVTVHTDNQFHADQVRVITECEVPAEEAACLVIIDEEGVDNDMLSIINAATACSTKPDALVNDQPWSSAHQSQFNFDSLLPSDAVCAANTLDSSNNLPVECGNPPFLWNKLAEANACGDVDGQGRLVKLPTGQVDDEGWFAPPLGPIRYADPSNAEGAPADYNEWLSRFVEGTLAQKNLDKVRDVMPLRNQDLIQLVGKTCTAIVYDSDISINYLPLYANLQGRRYGAFTFKVEAAEVPGTLPESSSSTSLYDLWLRVLPPKPPGVPLRIKIHDNEPDSIQVTTASFDASTRVLTIEGTSNYAGADDTPPYVEDPSSAVNDPNSVYNTPKLPTPRADGDDVAYMTFSVDNPADNDEAADPLVDPYIREVQMKWISATNRYRATVTLPAGVDLRDRRLVIQTDEGGSYNVRIR